jgi:hypothetical protein
VYGARLLSIHHILHYLYEQQDGVRPPEIPLICHWCFFFCFSLVYLEFPSCCKVRYSKPDSGGWKAGRVGQVPKVLVSCIQYFYSCLRNKSSSYPAPNQRETMRPGVWCTAASIIEQIWDLSSRTRFDSPRSH